MKKVLLAGGIVAGMLLWAGCNSGSPQGVSMQAATEKDQVTAGCTFYFTKQPVSQTINCGTTNWINFSVGTAGSNAVQYQWYYNYDNGSTWWLCNSKYFTGGTTANMSYAPQSPIYTYCQVKSSCGASIRSSTAKLTIRSVSITSQPQNQTDRCGYVDMKSFSVVATGSSTGYNYEWFFSQNPNGPWQTCVNDKYFTGGNTAKVVAYPVDTRYVRCVVDACGQTVTSNVAKFTVCWY